MSDLVTVAWSILRQPNVWVAFALLCVGTVNQFSRFAKARGWPRDRVYAGRAAAAAMSMALSVTLARVTPGLSVDWRGCGGGTGLPVDDAEAVLNVVLLVPWGVAAAYALRRFWPVFLAGVGASLLVELVQGLLGNGTCHSDDLVRNCVGAAVGAGIGLVLAHVYGSGTTPGTTKGGG
ncbi:VanZ family protein [Nocardioides islandensis]|uniref:VanZ family protein n=1 Tax=Nocardioides islandensis TaxID=433663 RepID=A0A930YKS6_9ACTN|nr:VanZ family protein [Nocardioides islandensis]MBF4763920.1 VanZ family protein [Nocardioides islandensis]